MGWNIFNELAATKEKLLYGTVSKDHLLHLSGILLQKISCVFQVKQQEFRNRFKNEVMFKFAAEDPYTCIDEVKLFWFGFFWTQCPLPHNKHV